MSIFGMLDAAAIPTNPFFVAAGEYTAEVVASKYQDNRNGEGRQLYIQYQINDEASAYHKNKVVKTYNLVDPDLTNETLALMPAEEQKKIRNTLASLKRDLCGNENNDFQKGLGVDVDDLNSADWDPKVLEGTKVKIGINNYGDNNQGVNVRWVNLDES